MRLNKHCLPKTEAVKRRRTGRTHWKLISANWPWSTETAGYIAVMTSAKDGVGEQTPSTSRTTNSKHPLMPKKYNQPLSMKICLDMNFTSRKTTNFIYLFFFDLLQSVYTNIKIRECEISSFGIEVSGVI